MGSLNTKEAGEAPGSWQFDEKHRHSGGDGGSGGSGISGLQLHRDAAVLDNLDKRAVERLWDNFVRESKSFAVNKEQLSRTFLAVSQSVENTKQVDTLFTYWAETAASKQYVDFMEIFMAVVCCSSMSLEDKVHRIFDCMDYEDCDCATLDAFTLTLKSAEAGLIKVKYRDKDQVRPASEEMIESVAKTWFADCADGRSYATRDQFLDFCLSDEREILWVLKLYEDAASTTLDSDLELENPMLDGYALSSRGAKDTPGSVDEGGMLFSRPWLQRFKPPLDWDADGGVSSSAPASQLKLSWIHGFRCHDCRNNARYSVDGHSVIYHAAGVGLVAHLDPETRQPRTQSFFQEHTDDIRAMATCSFPSAAGTQRTFVATGEVGAQPSIAVWCLPDGAAEPVGDGPLKSMWSLKGFHTGGISHLTFSIHGCTGAQEAAAGEDAGGAARESKADDDSAAVSEAAPTFRLLSVGLDRNHSVALYDLFLGQDLSQTPSFRLCCSEASDTNTVLFAASNPYDKEQFVTGGVRHLIFWRVQPQFGLARFPNMTSLETFVCAACIDKEVTVVGCVSGALKFFRLNATDSGTKPICEFEKPKAHRGTINVVHVCNSAGSSLVDSTQENEMVVVLTGGKDCIVRAWSVTREQDAGDAGTPKVTGVGLHGKPLWTLDMRNVALAASHLPRSDLLDGAWPSKACTVRSIDVCADKATLLVGVLGCEIFEIDLKGSGDESEPLIKPCSDSIVRGIVHGHWRGADSDGGLWGLATHPSLPEYATVGDDATLRLWDSHVQTAKFVIKLPGPARACAYKPDGSEIAIGFGSSGDTVSGNKVNGYFKVISMESIRLRTKACNEALEVKCIAFKPEDMPTLQHLWGDGDDAELKHEVMTRNAKQAITDIKYSPDGKILAVGSMDNSVYLYTVPDRYQLRCKFNKHNSRITHFDMSRDGSYMHTNSSAFESLLSQIPHARQISSAEEKEDIERRYHDWATWTCVLGWPVRGVWSACGDATNVTTVDRSSTDGALKNKRALAILKSRSEELGDEEKETLARLEDKVRDLLSGKDGNEMPQPPLLASADDSGVIRLFRFPCPDGQSQYHEYHGHTEEIASVRWSYDADCLVSVGSRDRCIFQWEHHRLEEEEEEEEDDDDDESLSSSESENEFGQSAGADKDGDSSSLVVAALESGGDEFMAVKPWLGAIKEPKRSAAPHDDENALDEALRGIARHHKVLTKRKVGDFFVGQDERFIEAKDLTQMTESLATAREHIHNILPSRGESSEAPGNNAVQLEWIHGYRSQDVRGNLAYVRHRPEDKCGTAIAYHAAAVGIVLHQVEAAEGEDESEGHYRQSFHTGHDDDIVSFAVHPSLEYVATGQLGKTPSIRIWNAAPPGGTDPSVLESRRSLEGFHKRAVSLLCFSDSGDLIASVGQDDSHSVAVYNWNSGALVSTAKGDGNKVLAMSFVPGSNDLVTCGVKHVRFWTVKGRNLSSKKGILGSKLQPFTCIGWKRRSQKMDANDVLIGTASGDMYIFDCKKRNLKSIISAHKTAAVLAITEWKYAPEQKGGEHRLRVISGGRDGAINFWSEKWGHVGRIVTPNYAPVSSLCVRGDGMELLIGTQASEIYTIPIYSEEGPPSKVDDMTPGWYATWKYDAHREQNDVSPLGAPVISGHNKDELWGLAAHPRKREYCTVGDDGTLRLWDVVRRRQCSPTVSLPCMARACAYYPNPNHPDEFCDDDFVAVGFGGSVGRGRSKKDGCLRVYKFCSSQGAGGRTTYSCKDKEFEERHDAHEWISDIKFTPNGKWLAAGAHDNNIYLYSVARDGSRLTLTKRKVFAKHSSYITHFDFSADSRYMQSNCGAYELLFCDVSTGRQITSATDVKNVVWDSWSCVLGWPVQGIWPPCADGTDVNSVARSNSNALVATADDFGKVKLFRYPCVKKGAGSLEYSGHSSHVTNVRWTTFDECLISTGGDDRSIFQWRHEIFERDERQDTGPDDELLLGDEATDDQFEALLISGTAAAHQHQSSSEDFMQRPWIGAVQQPKVVPAQMSGSPKIGLRLDWVYGYNSQDTRNNLFYTCESANSGIVYHAAAIGIVMKHAAPGKGESSTGQNDDGAPARLCLKQMFHEGHDDDISCLTISQDRQFVATGQVGSKPIIRIWHAVSCASLCTFPAFHERGIADLAFSPDKDGGSRQLLSVGQGDNHLHAVWRDTGGHWSKVAMVASARGDGAKIFFAHWLRPDGEYSMVSGGLRHLKFWSTSGPTLRAKKGLYGRLEKMHSTTITRAVNHFYVPNYVGSEPEGNEPKGSFCLVTSSLSGHLYRWEGRKRSPEPPLPASHPSPIHAMAAIGYSKETSRLVIGNNEGCVKVYGASLEKIVEYDLADLENSVKPRDLGVACIRSVDIVGYSSNLHPMEGHGCKILVGTLSSDIYEIKGPGVEMTATGSIENLHEGALVQGHFRNVQSKKDEVWGLAIDPNTKDLFATTGDDSTVRIWNMNSRKMLACFTLPSGGSKEAARTVAWSKYFNREGSSFLAVGLGGNIQGQKKGSIDGGVMLLSVPPVTSHDTDIHLTLLHRVSATDSGVAIGGVTDIKFFVEKIAFKSEDSPKVTVAVASQSGSIYVGMVDLEKQKLEFPPAGLIENDQRHASGNTDFANHLDFSECGSYLQSNWFSSDLRFHAVTLADAGDGKKEKVSGKTLCDETWDSWTCPLGWPVRGIWPAGADGAEINAVHRSSLKAYVAAADDFGKVKVFNYPCTVEGSPFVAGSGHSSRVTNVRFSHGDKHLITCGGSDRTVMQWKIDVTFDE